MVHEKKFSRSLQIGVGKLPLCELFYLRRCSMRTVSLPEEILHHIVSYLSNGKDYLNVLLTCSKLWRIGKSLEPEILARHYGLPLTLRDTNKVPLSIPGYSRHTPRIHTMKFEQEFGFSCYQFFQKFFADHSKRAFHPFYSNTTLPPPHFGLWRVEEGNTIERIVFREYSALVFSFVS